MESDRHRLRFAKRFRWVVSSTRIILAYSQLILEKLGLLLFVYLKSDYTFVQLIIVSTRPWVIVVFRFNFTLESWSRVGVILKVSGAVVSWRMLPRPLDFMFKNVFSYLLVYLAWLNRWKINSEVFGLVCTRTRIVVVLVVETVTKRVFLVLVILQSIV